MEVDVKIKVVLELVEAFCGAPGSAKESINVGSQHGGGVVQTKERVPSDFFQFSLPDHATDRSTMPSPLQQTPLTISLHYSYCSHSGLNLQIAMQYSHGRQSASSGAQWSGA